MKIYYYSYLYEKECIMNVYSSMYIDDKGVHFMHPDHSEGFIQMENIIKIVPDNG